MAKNANGDTMRATYNAIGQMIAEKWFDCDDVLVAHYKYTYDAQGNIVRSIDITAGKEYNYMYENALLTRAAEYDITISDELVTAKTHVASTRYYYDAEGTLTKKRVIHADGTESVIYHETNDDNAVVKFTAGEKTVTSHSKTDNFGRKTFDELQLGTGFVSRQFAYFAGDIPDEHQNNGKVKSASTTTLVSQIILSDGRTISYEYDKEERITKVTDSIDGTYDYTYDSLGQLTEEKHNGVVVNTMTYDNYGNILTKNGETYQYDTVWKDKLTAVGTGENSTITYDAQGNPLNYLGHTLTWEKGRQLKSFDSNSYTYNANGIRTSKTIDGIKHTYTLDGAKILREAWTVGNETNSIVPLYDNEDGVCGILYNNIPYFFLKNLQGDVIAITNSDGEVVARYTYDAWGVCTIASDTSGHNIATVNPYRYRSYYYDSEIGLYYLQSRYYNPMVGRFVNMDGCFVWDIEKTAFTANCYHYCENDPINKTDRSGKSIAQIVIRAIIGAILGAAMQYIADVLGNLLDCAIDNKAVTNSVWRSTSGAGDYLSSIVSGACDATLKIGVWKSIGISIAATIVGHIVNFAKGRGFSIYQLAKDLVWNALLSIVTDKICKKFKPSQGRKLNQYIRQRFKVKGASSYKRYFDLLCDCVEWNGYFVSTIVNTIRSASKRVIAFVEIVIKDCIIRGFEEVY